MRKYSSMFWKSAELPTAWDKHNCTVTSKIVAYSKLPLGNISNTFGAVDKPYWYAVNIVVITDKVHVAKEIFEIFWPKLNHQRKINFLRGDRSVDWMKHFENENEIGIGIEIEIKIENENANEIENAKKKSQNLKSVPANA